MSGLRIALLGPPSVTVDGDPIVVDTRKAIALLAYLAVAGRPQSRDSLLGVLWPDHSESRARAALRRTLSALNKALDGNWVAIGRDVVALDRDSAWIDLDAFEELLRSCADHGHGPREVCARCVDPLTEAVGLHRGDFLEGFVLRSTPEFDDWHAYQAERYRRELGMALERLVRALVEGTDLDRAVASAERWLQLDPLNEPAHRWLMLLHAWSGDRAAAQRRYRDCVAVLDRELGVSPLDETNNLYTAILDDRVPASPAGSDRGRLPEPLPGPALIGREQEVAALVGACRSASTDGSFVVVSGEAGIGKTRLVEEALAGVEDRRTVSVRCFEGETGIAYGPVAEALRGALAGFGDALDETDDRWLAEVARLVPDVVELRPDLPAAGPLDSAGAQARLYQGIVHVLSKTLAATRPGVLFFDDLQWADESSLVVLRYLIRRLRGRALVVVVAYRPEGLAEDDPVLQLAELADVRQNLGRLGPAEVNALARSMLGDVRADPIVPRLFEETEGLPFFCVEYLSAMAVADTGDPWEIPGSVREALRRRLSVLSGHARQVLTTGALIRRSFDLDTVVRASGRTEEETIRGLEELVAWQLVLEDTEGSSPAYAFGHERLRRLVSEQVSLARRRLLHRRIADALSEQRDPSHAALVALHLELAGRDTEAAVRYREAGDHARRLFAHTESIEHYRRALALGHTDPATLHEAIGDLQTLTGDYTSAVRSYEAAAALTQEDGRAALEYKLGGVHLRRGDWETADAHLAAALVGMSDDPSALRAHSLADRSLAARHLGDLDRAEVLGMEALDVAETAQEAGPRAKAHNALGILARVRGDLAEARRHLEKSLQLAEGLTDPAARIAALNNLALTLGAAGEHDVALEHARTALGVCAMQRDRHREAALLNNIADLLRASGRRDDAMGHLKEAVAIFAEVGGGGTDPGIWKLMEW